MHKLILSAVLLAASVSAPAFAAPAGQSAAVAYGDLNLSSHEGVKTLDQRIAAAAKTVCGFDRSEASLALRKAAQVCVVETRANAKAQRDHAVAAAATPAFAMAAR